MIIVEMISHLLSKLPLAPCTLSRRLQALEILFLMSGPEQVASVVRTPAPRDLNSEEIGKGTPYSAAFTG